MAVPRQRLEGTAEMVSACPEVNHNYEREHELNLWFVITAADAAAVAACAARIEVASRLPVMTLPLLDDYYIDLGFDLNGGRKAPAPRASTGDRPMSVDADDRRLLLVIESGLPLVPRPYEAVGRSIAMSGREVAQRLQRLVAHGVVKRLGVIVRHHECGYRHNAMVVWDVPDERVDDAGHRLADAECVRLCYRRPRRPPQWPYNLFCMIHGRDRPEVLAQVDEVSRGAGLESCPRDVLFSRRRFKQRGARYGSAGHREAAP